MNFHAHASSSAGRIAEAAIEVDRLRELKAMARKARNKQTCDLECNVHGGGKVPQTACWKNWDQYPGAYGDGPWELLPRDEWCAGCLRRQAAHDRFRELGRQLAGARRRVTMYVRQVRRQ